MATSLCRPHAIAFITRRSITGTRVLLDRLAGWARGGSSTINARDFPSIQDAIDALPQAGGTVLIPAGTYHLTETLYTPCDVPCHLIGEGCSDMPLTSAEFQGTTLVWSTAVDMLRVRGSFSSVRQLSLRNIAPDPAAQENYGRGLTIGRRNVADVHSRRGDAPGVTEYAKGGQTPQIKVLIEDVTIIGSPGWGVHIPGFGVISDGTTLEYDAVRPDVGQGGGTLSFWIDCKRVRVVSSRKFGGCFVGGGCTTTYFENCAFTWMGRGQGSIDGVYYAYLSGCVQAVFERCTFEGVSPIAAPWIKLRASEDCGIHTCWFEEDPFTTHVPTYFVQMTNRCRGGAIRDCHFVRASGCDGWLKLVKFEENGARGVTILNPYAVTVDPSTRVVGNGPEAYQDPAHMDLGGDGNTEIHVVGAGIYVDLARLEPGTSLPTVLPLQLADVPKRSTVQGAMMSTVPAGVYADLGPTATPPNGNLLMSRDLPGAGALTYFSAGEPGAWRLANNAPTLSLAQRDARAAWASGDMILNAEIQAIQVRLGASWQLVNSLPSMAPEGRDAQTWAPGDMLTTTEVNAAQMRTGTGWRLLNNAPPLTSTQRDLRLDWANGDLILNTTSGKLQIRVGGAWRNIAYS